MGPVRSGGWRSLDRVTMAVLSVAYLCLSGIGYLLVPRSGWTAGALWFPPTGLAFGYLVLTGIKGVCVVVVARVLGSVLLLGTGYLQAPGRTIGTDVLIALWYGLAAEGLRRLWRSEHSFGSLVQFMVIGTAVAPVGAATVTAAVELSGGVRTGTAAWAWTVLGDATAIATLCPAMVLVFLETATGYQVCPALPRRRRVAVVGQSVMIVLMPALVLMAYDLRGSELALLPLVLAPVGWQVLHADQVRGSLVLAACAVVMGAAVQASAADSTSAFRLQALLFAGAVAALSAGSGLITEARSHRSSELESTRWRALVEASPAVVARVDEHGQWSVETRGDAHATQPDPAEFDIVSRACRVPELVLAVRGSEPRTVSWGLDDKTGRRFVTHLTPLPDRQVLAVTTETTRLHSAEIALAWERSHDRATDMPNRDLLVATAEQALQDGGPASLVVIDLDQTVRRAELLEADPAPVILQLAERIRGALDPQSLTAGHAMVARTADDQFGLLLPARIAAARRDTTRMLRALQEPVAVPAGGLSVNACAGICALDPAIGARESLRRASAAAQSAAESGRGEVVVLDGVTEPATAEHARLVGDIVEAVRRQELEVVFQPDVRLPDGRLTGVEALVRWRPGTGLAATTELFVRLAEEAGAVQAIDAWVMEESLREMGEWRREHGARDLELALNVSALSLTDDLPERLLESCLRHGVPPWHVRLEVTETALADDSRATGVLREVRSRGCRVALDDFGTGYATLSRLHRLPVDVLKLDRSFLTPITDDPAGQALVSLVLGLADPLRVEVVVEGVETAEQRDVLVGLGAVRAQGYLFARPCPSTAIRRILDGGGVLGIPGTVLSGPCGTREAPGSRGVPEAAGVPGHAGSPDGPVPGTPAG